MIAEFVLTFGHTYTLEPVYTVKLSAKYTYFLFENVT
jgi:hypothetical protein